LLIKKVFTYIFFFWLILFSYKVKAQLIEKGKYELTSVQFIGNTEISTQVLQTTVAAKESPGWFSQTLQKYTSFGEEAVFFDPALLIPDQETIRDFYFSNGFFKAKVSSKYEIDTINNTAAIFYIIDEGIPAILNSFKISGLDELPYEFLETVKNIALVDTTKPFSGKLIDEKKNSILTFCRDHGYMLVNTIGAPLVVIDTIKNTVNVTIEFTLGNRYKVNEIRVEKAGLGKDLVEEELVKEVAAIKTDSYYSFFDIQKAQVRLYRTNLFNSAVITGIVSDTSGNKVPLNIFTDIGLLHELAPEIIINNEDNVFNLGFGLGYTRKNFLGGARKLTLSTSAAAQSITEFITHPSINDTTVYGYTDVRAILEQPFVFGQPINTKLENYLTIQKRKAEYNATLYGAKLSLNFELPRKVFLTSFTTYLNWEHSSYIYRKQYIIDAFTSLIMNNLNVKEDSALVIVGELLKDQTDKSIRSTNAVIGFDFGSNHTDNFFFPTQGYNLSIILEDGNLVPYLFSKILGYNEKSTGYFKTVFTGSAFQSLFNSKQNVIGVKLRAGYVFAYRGDVSLIPLNRRFYSGGSNSLRGWQSRELVPQETNFDLTNTTNEDFEAFLFKGVTPGGFCQLEGSIEARLRMFGQVGTAIFADFGNTWNKFKQVQVDEVAVAIGFGLRYYSDFAPIRLDFGFKFYDPSDRRSFFTKKIMSDTFQLHLGIGEAF